MRYLIAFLLLFLSIPVQAQELTAYIDSRRLDSLKRVESIMPQKAWQTTLECVSKTLEIEIKDAGPLPKIYSVPATKLLVRDFTVDSTVLFGVDAYAFVESNISVFAEPVTNNFDLQRHESLHFILYRLFNIGGHPPIFQICAPNTYSLPSQRS